MPKKLRAPRTAKIAAIRDELAAERKAHWVEKIAKRRARAALSQADKDAEAAEELNVILSIRPEWREAWRQKLAADEAKRLQIIAKSRRQPPGRDGRGMRLVEEQASDANEQTKALRNVANDPVEWLFARKSLSQRQHEAAIRIRADAEGMTIDSARGSNVERSGGGSRSPGALSDHQLDCVRRYKLCMEMLGRPANALVRAVVVDCKPLKDFGERMGWGPHYRAPRLAEALDVIGDFYRL